MRPIRLRFAGLRSYREPAEINFDGLDLFAVIGDTGAGKSTIIEALSFALYARKTWSGGKLEELVADGEKLLRVEFTFAAGDRTWQVTRTRNRTTTPGVNKLLCTETSEQVDGAEQVTARITELLGLDHSQFTRAVVLPQGRFDQLLQSRPAERNKLLASILGLDDVRRAGGAADTLAKQLEPVVAAAASRRSTFPDNPAAALAAAQAAATQAETNRHCLAAAVADATAIEARAARVDSAVNHLATVRRVVPEIGTWLNTLTQAQEDDKRLAGERIAAATLRDRAAAAEAGLLAAEDGLLAGFATRDSAVTARTELGLAAITLERAETDQVAAQELVVRLEMAPPVVEVPAELIAAEDAADAAHRDAFAASDTASAELEEARRAYDAVAAARKAVRAADEATDLARAANGGAAAALSAAEDAAAVASSAAVIADERYRVALTASAAAVAGKGCGPGDACPVCTRGLPDDFEAPRAPNVEHAEQERAAAQAAASAAIAASADARRTLTDAERRLEEALASASAARRTLDTATKEATGVRVDATDIEVGTADQQARLAEARLALGVAAAAQRDAHDHVTTARAQIAAETAEYRRQLDGARATVDAAESRAHTALVTVHQLPGRWRPDGPIGPNAIRHVVERITTMISDLDILAQRRRDLDGERRAAEQTLSQLTEAIATTVIAPAQRAIGDLNAYLARVDDVADALTQSAPVIERAVTATVSGTIDTDVDRLGDVIADAQGRLATAATTLAAAGELAEALDAERAAATADLAAILERARLTDITTLRHQAGVAESDATTARKHAEAAAEWAIDAERLDAVLATARPFVANLRVLSSALRDHHFLGHLIKSREAELLAEATRRLKVITEGRFGFVTDFGVVRLASGEIRSPDALSGGERFQAALALALALVEIASRGGGHLDAVFVDEGFGSLDATALESALATLATVAGGGRTVALISHLRSVAEYVDTVLHVTKDDALGSRIDVLTPDARDHLLADDIRAGLTV